MASIGQLLGGAGVVAGGMRQAEELERLARQNQLAIEARNRAERSSKQYEQQAKASPPYAGVKLPTAQTYGDVEVPPPVAAPAPAAAPAAAPVAAPAPASLTIPELAASLKASTGSGPTTRGRGRNPALRTSAEDLKATFALGASAAMGPLVPSRIPVQKPTPVPPLTSPQVQASLSRIPTAQLSREQFMSLPPAEQQARLDQYNKDRAAAPAAAPVAGVTVPGTGGAAIPEFDKIAAAVMQVESGGDPSAISPKGAVGTMQTMPETLRDPGFGVFPARDDSPQERERVGKDYLAAMIREFGGNLEHALAAYNWGPGATKNWVERGANFAQLPAETRNYVQKIRGILGGVIEAMVPSAQAAAPAAAAAPTPAAAAAPTPAAAAAQRRLTTLGEMSAEQPVAVQQALAQREEMVRLANMYLNMRTPESIQQYAALRSQILQAEASIPFALGMQGLSDLETANDPRRLASVWSYYANQPVGIQRRSDGTYNLFVNGERTAEGVSAYQLAQQARLSFDKGYQDQLATLSASEAAEESKSQRTMREKAFESDRKIAEEQDKQYRQMIREIFVEKAKGNIDMARAMFDASGYKVIKGDDGILIITPPGPGATPYLFNTSGKEQVINGIKVTSMSAVPMAGLPTVQQEQ